MQSVLGTGMHGASHFLSLRRVNFVEWARLPGDALFILGGSLPLV